MANIMATSADFAEKFCDAVGIDYKKHPVASVTMNSTPEHILTISVNFYVPYEVMVKICDEIEKLGGSDASQS